MAESSVKCKCGGNVWMVHSCEDCGNTKDELLKEAYDILFMWKNKYNTSEVPRREWPETVAHRDKILKRIEKLYESA